MFEAHLIYEMYNHYRATDASVLIFDELND